MYLKKYDIIIDSSGNESVIVEPDNMTISDYISKLGHSIKEIKRPTLYETIYVDASDKLDLAEKRYLKSVIKPFREDVQTITKFGNDKYEWIEIRLDENRSCHLPTFPSNTQYIGLARNKTYTIAELKL